MTNGEKYRTVLERGMAFANYCHSHSCSDCALSECDGYCKFKWLEMEAEEELLSCPFCGGKARVDKDLCHTDLSKTFYSVICKECGVDVVINAKSKEEAIEKWNRRVN